MTATASAATTTSSTTTVSMLSTSQYGPVLVVGGSGGLAGTPLYAITSDANGLYGCTTTKMQTGLGELICTGPESDFVNRVPTDDWPAFTTPDGKVAAGPGVNAALLGVVARPGIGNQVTYGGHPLYLFDPASKPFVPAGENLIETSLPLPPWHGIWYLVGTAGGFAPSQATLLGEAQPHGQSDLAVSTSVNFLSGGAALTVYTLSGDSPGVSRCTAVCARSWMPVLTTGAPKAVGGLTGLGTLTRSDGSVQVTYHGMPLYIYSSEVVPFTSVTGPVTTGSQSNGQGIASPGDGKASVVPVAPLTYTGLSPTGDGKGYYLSSTTGLLDGFGDASGVTTAVGTLNTSGVAAIVASGGGGWIIGADGGVFNLVVGFYGSATGFRHAGLRPGRGHSVGQAGGDGHRHKEPRRSSRRYVTNGPSDLTPLAQVSSIHVR